MNGEIVREQEEFLERLLRVLEGNASEAEQVAVEEALDAEKARLDAMAAEIEKMRQEALREIAEMNGVKDAYELQMELRSELVM